MIRSTINILLEKGAGKENIWKYKIKNISSCLYGIANLINKAYTWRTSPLDKLISIILVICTRIKDVIYSIEIPPYKAVERGCKINNIVHDLMYSWFLIYIKDLDPINSQPQEVLTVYRLMLLDSSVLLNISENL